jgi:tyrosine-protein phosphatase OCA1
MKKFWGILCVTLLAFGQITWGEDATLVSRPAAPVAASAPASLNAAWPTSNAVSHRIKADGVPNFGKLNDYIWRSGQPTREGYQLLAKQGLKTVVNLREEFPQDKDLIPQGVRYVYLPIKDEHAPTDEQAKAFLDLVSKPENWPILVHCHGGEGRAGVMSALVRTSLDRWDHSQIMKEVGNFRKKYLGFIPVPMAGSQKRFIQHWEEMPALLPPSHSVNQPAIAGKS